ncbi:hypothetical protein BHM03_00011867 [Ensete ventricosum]|uniref:FLZ-type domain-containing protein n=1 Tax=Ensete ventricosum TaxID=4639 RepID=A0A427A3F8_ENSVE|nr:hypothetical protein B296_00035411 [Ensete ventricosum]RZR84947.1 hypothetical protein BHM03_00011867 [Ensete ventricosum]
MYQPNIFLRKRSRAVGGKQGLMASFHGGSSSCGKPSASSLLPSAILSEAAMSPTSTPETRNLSSIGNHIPPFDAITTTSSASVSDTKQRLWRNGGSRPTGLGIIDALSDEQFDSKPQRRMVLLGTKLKIQIPSLCPTSNSPVGSPIEFGIKNRDSQLALLSPARRSPGLEMPASSPRVFAGSIFSMSEMELSEDYTCVIFHGPNPRTTHIFDSCAVEQSGDGFTRSTKSHSFAADSRGYPLNDSLSLCYACKKNVEQGKETFMYK